MIFGAQLASMAIIFSIAMGFLKQKRLPLLSSRWFERYLWAAMCNHIFEIITLITLYNIDVIPAWVNRLAHQLFYISLMTIMLCFFLFLDIRSRKQKRYNRVELFVRNIVYVLMLPYIFIGEINYHIGDDGRYSTGPVVAWVMICLATYIISDLLLVFHVKDKFSKKERATIIYGLINLIVIFLVEMFNPSWLVSSIGVALLALHIFMTFENPIEYRDPAMPDLFNKHAFSTMLHEYIEAKKEFYIVSMTLTNASLLKESKGYEETTNLVHDAADYLKKYTNQYIFHSKRDFVSVIFTDKKEYFAFMEEQRELFSVDGHEEHGAGKFFVSILKCPEYAATPDEILSIIDYVDKIKGDVKEKILRIDEEFLAKKHRMSQVEGLVQAAIEHDGFDVFYQPIFSNEAKRFVSAEALVRLSDTKTLGYVSPEEFIPIAEENGMIGEVGRIVFTKVCQFISENNLAELGIDYVEVNLSGAQFMDYNLNNILSDCVKEYKISPEFINLEITETASIEAGEMLEYNMRRLKECRFRFSMDDFGTGYSNLAKMADADFDLIKLDKTLIWPCFEKGKQEESRVILESCIDMIHKLGKQVVAEGVETKEQVDYLTKLNVRYLQGYYFSRPVCAEKYLDFMKKTI